MLYPDKMVGAFPAKTFERMAKVAPEMDKTELVRVAVEKELKAREKAARKPKA